MFYEKFKIEFDESSLGYLDLKKIISNNKNGINQDTYNKIISQVKDLLEGYGGYNLNKKEITPSLYVNDILLAITLEISRDLKSQIHDKSLIIDAEHSCNGDSAIGEIDYVVILKDNGPQGGGNHTVCYRS
ncbi:hypothetical protein [Cardinium endosymbiont of Culicoides punctatus]|uniref:hypothetical protein n=1 Tax=Cardinium endosymbiont of Culicoides punctatus TaxID=2304601 RepID=UPI001058C57A|nr:hypothetical protein [Cardinium endosymbiont of Culicoides punctatus]TDG95788.1 hypothetical protein CCPUN_00730 [Cardinium endosymbiont of Culicoides punctatus]